MFYFLIESRLPLCSYIVMPNVHKIVSLAWPMKLYEHYKTETSVRQTSWPFPRGVSRGKSGLREPHVYMCKISCDDFTMMK